MALTPAVARASLAKATQGLRRQGYYPLGHIFLREVGIYGPKGTGATDA